MRVILLAALMVFLATPTWAEEVLFCTDGKASGITWKGPSTAKSEPFQKNRYTVRIVSKTERLISRSEAPKEERELGPDRLTCSKSRIGLIHCKTNLGATTWLFKGDQFTRAYLYGRNLGGDNTIWLSFGTCTKF